MPISGLVISIDCDKHDRQTVVKKIDDITYIKLGQSSSHRIPAVLETPSPRQDRQTIQEINDIPGVTFIDVVFVHFDQEEEGTQNEMADRSA